MKKEENMKKDQIIINQKELEKWWITLNKWELPKELRKPQGDEKQFIRGAFAVVDHIITHWKYPKFIKRKSNLTPLTQL
jgi:hypothetical protein